MQQAGDHKIWPALPSLVVRHSGGYFGYLAVKLTPRHVMAFRAVAVSRREL